MNLFLLLLGCDGGEDVFLIKEGFAGCGSIDTGATTGFATELTPVGCHYQVSAVDENRGTRLVLDVPAFADLASGNAISQTYTLPDTTVRLELEFGCLLDAGVCDPGDTGSPFVSSTMDATAGSVAVTGTPASDGTGSVDVTFSDVAFAGDNGGEASISSLSWTGITLESAR